MRRHDERRAGSRTTRPLALARDRLLAGGLRRPADAVGQVPDPERDRDPRPVRALARPDPGLCRHRLAGPRRLLRRRRLHRGPSGQARHRRSAGRPRRGDRGRHDRGLPHQLPGAARQRPHAPDGDAGRGAGAGRDRQRLPAHHRRRRRPAGCRHGQAFGPLRVRPVRPHRLRLQPDDAVRADAAGAAHRAFAVRPVADVDPPQPAARRSARRAGAFAPDRGLHARRRLCRRGRRAARPDHGLRLARRLRVPSLGRSAAGADHRRRGLALWRHRRRGDLQDAAGRHRDADAAVLAVLDRPVPGHLRHGRPRNA